MKRLLLFSFTCLLLVGVAAPSHAIDINGGTSWNGWTYRGLSTDDGVFGTGSTSDVYKIYTTVFVFAGQPVTGSPVGDADLLPHAPYTTGAWANGDLILGVGVERVSGGTIDAFPLTVRFDLANDSYNAAFPLATSGNGKTSSSSYADAGDFNCQINIGPIWEGANLGVFNGRTLGVVNLPGGFGSGTGYDYAFRGFAQLGSQSYQTLYDLTAMPALYGPGGPYQTGVGVGTIGASLTIAINGLGGNNSVVKVLLDSPTPIQSSTWGRVKSRYR